MQRCTAGLFAMLCMLVAPGCEQTQTEVLHRSSCVVCHAPLNEDGDPVGIEQAHPAWPYLSCVDCHGGNDRTCDGEITEVKLDTDTVATEVELICSTGWVYEKDRAHVLPGDGPEFIKNLRAAELDQVPLDYIRFINPGDFRVLDQTCAQCHLEAADVVPRSTMSHTSGEVAVARYRAGAQPTARGVFAAFDVTDPAPEADNACGVAELQQLVPDVLDPTDHASLTVANVQDQYIAKSCLRCHLYDFGENRFEGDYRSSGCTACHMTYADDGLSRSADPRVKTNRIARPERHVMEAAPPTDQCVHCHYRGGRIGISYQGYRESGGPGLNPPRHFALGQALHGHDANYYLFDENDTNLWDETPADVHFEAGMHCVDCHGVVDSHGNGHLYADTQCAVETRCEDCHGTAREYATIRPDFDHVSERDGELWLTTKRGGIELRIKQVKDIVTDGHPDHTALGETEMGVNAAGFSHTDEVECYTCHAGWSPSCYGCHVTVDMTGDGAYQSTGELTPGATSGDRAWVVMNDLVLMRGVSGKMAPSMPAERFFMSVLVEDEAATAAAGELVRRELYSSKPRSFTKPNGDVIPGFGQRAFNPHSIRSRSQFMACDRCHSVESTTNPPNEVLLDLTYGFGTQRFPYPGCDVTNADDSCDPATDWTVYQLDAIQTRAGEPLVVVGHDDPQESRPLSLEEIQRMRDVVVRANEAINTDVPANAATDPRWPKLSVVEDHNRYPVETAWRNELTVPPASLISIWGASQNDIWTVGMGADGAATARRIQGETWEPMDTGFDGDLWWVHGFANGPVFLGGTDGTILEYDGTDFTPMDTDGVTSTVFGIWGASPTDVWAVGGDALGGPADGFILRYDGTDWRNVATDVPSGGESPAFFKVWGRNASDVKIVGANGVALAYNGTDFVVEDTPTTVNLLTVHTSEIPGRPWVAVGGFALGVILENDGSGWRDVSPQLSIPGLFGVVVTEDTAWAVGNDGVVLQRANDSTADTPWSIVVTGLEARLSLHAVWVAPGGDVYGAGGNLTFPPFDQGYLIRLGLFPVYE